MGDSRIPYALEARTLDLGDEQELITGHRLEAAGTSYPQEIKDLYTRRPGGRDRSGRAGAAGHDPGRGGDDRTRTGSRCSCRTTSRRTRPSSTTPTSRDFTCDSRRRSSASPATKRGYCLHYASTMAILLRAATRTRRSRPASSRASCPASGPATPRRSRTSTPTRGSRSTSRATAGSRSIRPGGVGQPTAIADGPTLPPADRAVPSARRHASRRTRLAAAEPAGRRHAAAGGGGARRPRAAGRCSRSCSTVVVVTIALAAWVRGPRGQMSPDTAWQSMSKAATRFGFGPKPTQTVYEYATALGELVPGREGRPPDRRRGQGGDDVRRAAAGRRAAGRRPGRDAAAPGLAAAARCSGGRARDAAAR